MFAPLRFLSEQAAKNPGRPALVSVDGSWSFSELELAVAAVARRLRELGIAPRQLVATDLAAADDWITTLALLRIATRTVSMAGVGAYSGLALDALITKPGTTSIGTTSIGAAQVIVVDRLWMEQVVAEADDSDPRSVPTVLYPRADSICRVILTSGTTGTPRAAELSVRAVEHRLEHLPKYWTAERPEVNLMSLSTTGGFHTALASLQHGTPYVAVSLVDERSVYVAAQARVQVLAGSPVQIGQTLRLLREQNQSLPDLKEVRTAGAPPTPSLLATIAEQLSVPVLGVYGSTEGGGVSSRMLHLGGDVADVGTPIEGIELDIVDEQGVSVAPGTSGEIRYRGPGLASGYSTEDPDHSFRSGWFHPGDRGSLTAEGALILEGRASEIVNVGGVKIDPATVDAAVEGFPGVIDAGTFIIEQVPGVPELGIAIVAEASCDLRALDQLLRKRLPGKHPTVFGQVAAIPRNRMGKVERARLTSEFRRRLKLE
jgi:acyl-coenzyme A synthetase/AMP-(fatty) acid ligase